MVTARASRGTVIPRRDVRARSSAATGSTSSTKTALDASATTVEEVRSCLTDVGSIHAHCAVYTEPRVAEAVLDRIGWAAATDLRGRRLLEPACGDGSFLLPAIERLIASLQRHGACDEQGLLAAIVAFEFDSPTASALTMKIVGLLKAAGLSGEAAKRVAAAWLRCEDFLLAGDMPAFSDVVGNPPYMRWSKVPATLKLAYEKRLPAYAARGDLCLAFVCRAVRLLREESGRVAFLCADRWLRCAYGADARVELERAVRLSLHLEVHDVRVFVGSRKVGAYAAITVLDRDRRGEAVVARATSVDDLCKRLLPEAGRATASHASRLKGNGGAILAPADLAAAFSAIVESTPVLADVGIEVRCGMALGCAPAFVVDGETEIEAGRLLPWVRTRDLREDGTVEASAQLVDVWDGDQGLVDLRRFPSLRAHLESYKVALKRRACVVVPAQWYRTIDRTNRARMEAPKILIAGMAKFSRVALSGGGAQPSNAIYSLSSSEWPLAALFAVLRSGALDVFGAVLSPRFAGGVKRFDGNLLRQVRLPPWSRIEPEMRQRLLSLDVGTATPRPELLAELYGISHASHQRALAAATRRN